MRAVLRNGDIGRLEIGWLAANAGAYAFLVVTLVAAYEAGGALAAGLLAVVRYAPPAVVSSLAGVSTSRWRSDRVLLAVNLSRTVSMALTLAVVATHAPAPLLFLFVASEAGFGGLTRPLHLSILPWLARTPGELVASNIASSAAEGIGTLLGPAIAGVLLATSGPYGATAAAAVLMGIAVVAVATISVPTIRTARAATPLVSGLTAGFRAAARVPAVRLVLTGFWLQTLVRGLLTVLLVVAAIDRLDIGEPGVGTLQAAIGAGGFIGAIVSLSLTSRTQFGPTFALSLALWGLPIAVIGIVTYPIAAIAMLAIVGMSNALLDVTGFTILQRTCPNQERVALMGLFDSMAAATTAIGGLLASALLAALGIAGALVVTGAILPLAAAMILPSLRRAESQSIGHEASARLLRADPLLSLLSLSIIEELAAVVQRAEFADGEYLIREGEAGDAYLIVSSGEVEVSQGGRPLHRLGPGSGVGEISLLRDIPRTASVRAIGPVEAYSLARDAFLAAVTGQTAVRIAANAIAEDHLAGSSTSSPL